LSRSFNLFSFTADPPEEVADHTMMLLLSVFRDTVEQDRLVREGRTPLLQIPIPRSRGIAHPCLSERSRRPFKDGGSTFSLKIRT
jgi:lactate dehydrogenase-like 2-hydroxyacid dehydrogenase